MEKKNKLDYFLETPINERIDCDRARMLYGFKS